MRLTCSSLESLLPLSLLKIGGWIVSVLHSPDVRGSALGIFNLLVLWFDNGSGTQQYCAEIVPTDWCFTNEVKVNDVIF